MATWEAAYSKQEWNFLRLGSNVPAGEDHIFPYTVTLGSRSVEIRLITRGSDKALGCAEECCKDGTIFNWFGSSTSHRGEGAAFKHARASHGPVVPRPLQPKKKKLLPGQQLLFQQRPTTAASVPAEPVAVSAVGDDDDMGMSTSQLAEPPLVSNFNGFNVLTSEEQQQKLAESNTAIKQQQLAALKKSEEAAAARCAVVGPDPEVAASGSSWVSRLFASEKMTLNCSKPAEERAVPLL
jgi:hypothetical protein